MKFLCALFLACALAAAPVLAAPTRTVQQLGPVKVGAACPTFGGFTLENEPLSLAKLLKPGKGEPATVVVISFFASYCKVCKERLPSIERVVERLRNKGARGVLIDYGEDAETASQFAQAQGLHLPVIADKFAKISERLGVDKTLPRTFVVDRQGVVTTIFDLEGDDFEKTLSMAVERAMAK
jgi:peroxiredoxin